jgi:hypothetical protein
MRRRFLLGTNAAAFRFLRQPLNPNAPKPVAISDPA